MAANPENMVLSLELEGALDKLCELHAEEARKRSLADPRSPYRPFNRMQMLRYIVGLYALEHYPEAFLGNPDDLPGIEKLMEILEKKTSIPPQEIRQRVMLKDVAVPYFFVSDLFSEVYYDLVGHMPCPEDL